MRGDLTHNLLDALYFCEWKAHTLSGFFRMLYLLACW